jgi:hypothetical protein
MDFMTTPTLNAANLRYEKALLSSTLKEVILSQKTYLSTPSFDNINLRKISISHLLRRKLHAIPMV